MLTSAPPFFLQQYGQEAAYGKVEATSTDAYYGEETTPASIETESDAYYGEETYGEETTPVATETESVPSYGEETTPVATETESAPAYGKPEETTPVATETESYMTETIVETETLGYEKPEEVGVFNGKDY